MHPGGLDTEARNTPKVLVHYYRKENIYDKQCCNLRLTPLGPYRLCHWLSETQRLLYQCLRHSVLFYGTKYQKCTLGSFKS